jgi:A/G-specific adenine glycosylase
MSLDDALRDHLIAHRDEARERLLSWFAAHARDLPWRHDRTPYRIWVSEVMLQQTQVETVRGYYERFLERLPTVHALADAPQEEVLKLWEGLGYYSRARSLHQAAREVVESYGGELPADVEALRALPGIGAYTSGAIASLAFGVPAPAVDGNVRRVLARVLALERPKQSELEDAVRLLIPDEAPGLFNEALIELGATLCRPQNPRCLLCPWRELCKARQLGRQEDFPAPKARRETPHYDVTAAVTVREDGCILVAQRKQDAMLGGLWEFPGGKREEGETLEACLRRELQEELEITVEVGERLTKVKHGYTHFRITLYAFWCRLVKGTPRCLDCADFRWVTLEELQALPMAVTDRKIARALERELRER